MTDNLKDVFAMIDENGDNILDKDELRLLLNIGFGEDVPINNDVFEEMLRTVDEDGDGAIGVDEFMKAKAKIENEI